MKKLILIIGLFLAQMSFAKVVGFNEMIDSNHHEEIQLKKEIRQQVGIEDLQTKKGRDLLAEEKTEEIQAETLKTYVTFNKEKKKTNPVVKAQNKQEKLERVAEELNQINE